jgi:hypothetical protein
MPETTIQIGDYVHGRLYNEDRTNVVVQDFSVKSIDGTTYTGGVIDCDTSLGWEIELIRKSVPNLNLPQELSEITGYDRYNKKIHLTGKARVWRDNGGNQIDIETLVTWENGHV